MSDAPVLTVTELNQCADGLLRDGLGRVRVEGEVSNLRQYASGHQYFSLKDENSSVSCVLFRGNARNAARFADGDAVQIQGRAGIYAARGQFQIIVEQLQPAGEGQLLAAFQRLKEKLAAEGLFDPERKKPLPAWTHRLGVITSTQGDVRHDIERTLARRFPLLLPFTLYPTAVQGAQAASQIVAALEQAAREGTVDVIILARGGGSLEDLQAFNEESVARAIAASPIPVVTGVGHETDTTIADFVADLRASTPTAAAEAVSPDGATLRHRIERARDRMTTLAAQRVAQHRQTLNALWTRLERRHPRQLMERNAQRLDDQHERLQRAWQRRHEQASQRLQHLRLRLAGASPGNRIASARMRLDHLHQRLARAAPAHDIRTHRERLARLHRDLEYQMRQALTIRQQRLQANRRQLNALGPQAVLERGYAILQTKEGQVLRDAARTEIDAPLKARLARGALELKVTATKSPEGD
ncbi:exodeoxyribonuclease VII large subunit [Thioalkalivibrio thiocyanoxidans]|uniref:exodeoxyribonuclease VII large subunit n=1 Tax=Thioalkalivibrio thiocyanoxidans TaxID=152475 RepID=UPI0003630BCB|nr:exodeoxyribonuclease VII large subunit [Thioalkalivibrio thiocyanoxidans]